MEGKPVHGGNVMAISGISEASFFTPSLLISRNENTGQQTPARTSDANPPPVTAAAAQETSPVPQNSSQINVIQQSEQFINQALRNSLLNLAGQDDPLLTNTASPFLATLQTTRELNPFEQNALLINQVLQNLNFVPTEATDALLINEIPPALEAADVFDNLDFIQQNDLLVNETLRDLTGAGLNRPVQNTGADLTAINTREASTTAAITVASPQIQAAVLEDSELIANTTVGQEAEILTSGLPEIATAAVEAPVREILPQPRELVPATAPLTLYPDRTPYVLNVHEVRNPSPTPEAPAPVAQNVRPVRPKGEARAVDNLVLRQAWEREQERKRQPSARQGIVSLSNTRPVNSIRRTIRQVNEDMTSKGLPIHLVLARHEDGYAVDIYDCSYGDSCRLTYDVPLELNNLTVTLDKMEHQTGIIVDSKA